MTERSELEKRIIRAENLGQDWVNKHEVWLQLDEAKKSVLSDIVKDLDDGEQSEVKLERLARASKQYREYINNLSLAKGAELRARVKYDCAMQWVDAGRTAEATARAKMQYLKEIP